MNAYWFDDEIDDDPPLYPAGKLASMTIVQLNAELDRQCNIQGALGDAEYIDDRAVERAESRIRMVENEIKRRATP